MAAAEGVERIDQHDVQIAGEATVLKAVVHDKDVGGELLDRTGGAADTVGIDEDGRLRQDGGGLGDFIGRFAAAGAVAARENGGFSAGFDEAAADFDDEGRFAGSAGGDVADADDGSGGAHSAARVERFVAKLNGEAV